jgi:hypothetical protein
MKNRAAVSLGKKSAEARRLKHGPKFNEHMQKLSMLAAQRRIDKKAEL